MTRQPISISCANKDLLEHFRLDLEADPDTLAGHTMHHECEVGADAGALGTVDASRGDELIGWDTDQFPASLYLTTQVILTVWKMGGFTTGGLDFDAKVRRESFEPIDLFLHTLAEWMPSRAD